MAQRREFESDQRRFNEPAFNKMPFLFENEDGEPSFKNFF